MPLTPGTKRAFKGSLSTISVSSKRPKNNTKDCTTKEKDVEIDEDHDDNDSYSNFQKNVMTKLDRNEVNGKHMRLMFEQMKSYHEQHEKTQLLILENQKKIKKALLKNRIYVDIEESTSSLNGSETIDTENTFPSELSYSPDGGKTFFNALLISADRTKKNLYALKLMDRVFDQEELLELDPLNKKQEFIEHPSYLFIKEAVRCKFRLTSQQLEIEWPNIHDAMLNKRRNLKKSVIRSITTDDKTNSNRDSIESHD